jgi:hypothetical protein
VGSDGKAANVVEEPEVIDDGEAIDLWQGLGDRRRHCEKMARQIRNRARQNASIWASEGLPPGARPWTLCGAARQNMAQTYVWAAGERKTRAVGQGSPIE